MRLFFDRELKRVEYFRGRFELRKEELSKKPLEEEDPDKKDDKKEVL